MAKLKFIYVMPPRGWIYLQPETRLRITSDNLDSLADKVIAHRRQKEIASAGKAEVIREIQRQICTRLTTVECRKESPTDPWVPLKGLSDTLTLASVLNASKALFTWITSGRPVVPLEENERRRQICLSCPLNERLNGCRCAALYRAVAESVPAERQFDDLHVCLACKCSLKAKCAVPAELIELSERGRGVEYPIHCWVPEILDTRSRQV